MDRDGGRRTSRTAARTLSHRTGIKSRHLGYLSAAADLALFAAAIGASTGLTGGAASEIFHMAQIFVSGLMLALFIYCSLAMRLHDPRALVRRSGIGHVAKAVMCFGTPFLAALLVCVPFYGSSDPAVTTFIDWLRYGIAIGFGCAIVSRLAFLLVRAQLGARMLAPERLVIVGSGESARRMMHWLTVARPRLAEVAGVFDDRGTERVSDSGLAGEIRGNTRDLIEFYKRVPFDKIVMALPHSAEERVLHLLRRLRQLPVDIVLAPDLIGFRTPDQEHMDVAGLQLRALTGRPIREPQRLIKGAIDRVLSAVILIFLTPLLLGVALAIRLDSPGPILFRQPRQGLGDTLFDVFKFRTMRQDLGDAVGRQQTKRGDPRVTRVGAWLRRTSIDELPQLFNVLRGEMSLVGPRPHTPHMLIEGKRIFDLVDEYSFRHRVKPGITGLAQVNGYRGAIDTPEQLRARINYDLYYIDNWSLWLDFRILCQTALCLGGANAF
jgi:putative colanic acid biosynthesis UDP-glucose lipid carrier transferase